MSQVNKQQSIEKQQQIDLRLKALELKAKVEAGQAKAEQDKKEYIVKRKQDCYDLETAERKKFGNVDGSNYNELDDVCIVRYVNKEWKEGDPNSCNNSFECLFEENCECIERYFSKEF